MLRYLTAGESHGPALTVLIEGLPAGVPLRKADIDFWLAERQKGHGRGGRMKIEKDQVRILSGLRDGKTLGSPLALLVENRDWENWKKIMDPEAGSPNHMRVVSISRPRPGHADLAGGLKYDQEDLRNILERASARETTARVAAGAVAAALLAQFDVELAAHVISLGGVDTKGAPSFEQLRKLSFLSPVRCADAHAAKAMIRRIDQAKAAGDSLGGVFEVRAKGLPVGLGSHVQWDRKLDARLAQALMSIQSVKGVELGMGFQSGRLPGSKVHDEIAYRRGRYAHLSNNAGGIEGGMSNGEELCVRACMKPIPTLLKPLRSVDMRTHQAFRAKYERSDVCTVPAGAVVGLAVVALTLADAFLEKFGGDSLGETRRNWQGYLRQLKAR